LRARTGMRMSSNPTRNSALVCLRLTFCPPGPDEGLWRKRNADPATVAPGARVISSAASPDGLGWGWSGGRVSMGVWAAARLSRWYPAAWAIRPDASTDAKEPA